MKRRHSFSRKTHRRSSGRSTSGIANRLIRVGMGVAVGQGVTRAINATVGNMNLPVVGNISKVSPLIASYAAYKAAGGGLEGFVAATPTLAEGGFNVLGGLFGNSTTSGATSTTSGATF